MEAHRSLGGQPSIGLEPIAVTLDAVNVTAARVAEILTRTSGFLRDVCSHSLQPYRGCSFGHALCGVACYVQHNGILTRGAPWGSFLEVRENAAEAYRATAPRERNWARKSRGRFGIFLSSSTEPFLPQERKFGVTRAVLDAMRDEPPDFLILQTHSHQVADHAALLMQLAARTELRVHLSIETDRERLEGLPPHASSIADRFAALETLATAGIRTVVTVSPLLPIADPDAFFARIARHASAVVIDHFIEGDGTPDGHRTLATALPAAMEAIEPISASLAYREQIVRLAERHLPGRVGVSREGFAGRYRPA